MVDWKHRRNKPEGNTYRRGYLRERKRGERVPKKNFMIRPAIIGVLLSLLVSWNAFAGENGLTVTTTVGGEMTFQLSGGQGVFFENKPCYYTVQSNHAIVIQFSASDLIYLGPYPERAKLNNVFYWLNKNRRLSFKPGQVLLLSKEPGVHEFSIHGKVTINAVEDQPAGDYAGTIYVTVSPAK